MVSIILALAFLLGTTNGRTSGLSGASSGTIDGPGTGGGPCPTSGCQPPGGGSAGNGG